MFKSIFPLVFTKAYDNYHNNYRKPKVLVLGNGYAGQTFSSNLNQNNYHLTVIGNTNDLLQTHKMYSDNVPLKYLRNDCYYGNVDKIDADNKHVILDDEPILRNYQTIFNYDYLVFALGSQVNTFGIKGVDKHCYFYKTMEDWDKIEKIKNNFQNVSIIGGGAVGIELAYKLNKSGNDVTIIEAFDILPNYSNKTRIMVKQDLAKKNIRLVNQKVSEICEDSNEKIIKFASGQQTNSNVCVWTAGIKKHSLLVTGKQNIFNIGDNSINMPMTAQKAVQEAKYLAKYFNSGFDEKYSPQKFVYREIVKTIHTDDGVFVEFTDNITIKFPKWVGYLIDLLIDLNMFNLPIR